MRIYNLIERSSTSLAPRGTLMSMLLAGIAIFMEVVDVILLIVFVRLMIQTVIQGYESSPQEEMQS